MEDNATNAKSQGTLVTLLQLKEAPVPCVVVLGRQWRRGIAIAILRGKREEGRGDDETDYPGQMDLSSCYCAHRSNLWPESSFFIDSSLRVARGRKIMRCNARKIC